MEWVQEPARASKRRGLRLKKRSYGLVRVMAIAISAEFDVTKAAKSFEREGFCSPTSSVWHDATSSHLCRCTDSCGGFAVGVVLRKQRVLSILI